MTDGSGTTQYAYQPIGSLGALQLLSETSPLSKRCSHLLRCARAHSDARFKTRQEQEIKNSSESGAPAMSCWCATARRWPRFVSHPLGEPAFYRDAGGSDGGSGSSDHSSHAAHSFATGTSARRTVIATVDSTRGSPA
jgi:hypothetical protein